MDTSLAALPVARILLGMAERRTSGLLSVHAGTRVLRISLRDGRVYGVDGTSHALLGDVLRAQLPHHTLSLAPVSDAMEPRMIGSQLVETGAVSASELRRALCTLHTERLRWMFTHAELRVGALGPLPPLGAQLRASVALSVAVLEALCMAHDLPCFAADAALLPLLNARGARLFHALLRTRTPARSGPPTAAQRVRQIATLRALGLCSASPGTRSYTVLLRKRRDVARRASPARLLELAQPDARADVRPALRGFARQLHPDLFARAHPSLAREASEVFAALTRAADSLLAAPVHTSRARSPSHR